MAGHQRRRTPRREADGRTGGHPGGQRTGGALYYDYGWAYMLALWGKGGYGGSPKVEAGKMYQHPISVPISLQERLCDKFVAVSLPKRSRNGCFASETAVLRFLK